MKKLALKKKIANLTNSKKVTHVISSFSSFFKHISMTKFLVFTIIVFAFFLGMLTNKVIDLEQQVKNTSAPTTAAATAGTNALLQATPAPAGPVNVAVGNYPVQGDPNAKVTVIEFADFRCPFCEQWFKNTEPSLMKDYVNNGKVKFYFRDYAFLGPASTLAAEAAECANDQNQFWALHDYLYQNQPDESDTSMYTIDNLSQVAGTLGMDQTQFQSCLSSKKDTDKAAKDLSDGQKAGVNGTPTVFINGIPLVGAVPYDQLKQQIDAALKN